MTHYSEAHQATKFADGMRCHYCELLLNTRTFSRDHIVPRALGGEDETYNIVPSCKQCNRMKCEHWTCCTCATCTSSIGKHAQLGVTQVEDFVVNPQFRVFIYADGTCIRRTHYGSYQVDPVTFKRMDEVLVSVTVE